MSYSQIIRKKNIFKILASLKAKYLIIFVLLAVYSLFVAFYFYYFKEYISILEAIPIIFVILSSTAFIFYSVKLDYCWEYKKLKKYLSFLLYFISFLLFVSFSFNKYVKIEVNEYVTMQNDTIMFDYKENVKNEYLKDIDLNNIEMFQKLFENSYELKIDKLIGEIVKGNLNGSGFGPIAKQNVRNLLNFFYLGCDLDTTQIYSKSYRTDNVINTLKDQFKTCFFRKNLPDIMKRQTEIDKIVKSQEDLTKYIDDLKINKIELKDCEYIQEKYNEIKKDVEELLTDHVLLHYKESLDFNTDINIKELPKLKLKDLEKSKFETYFENFQNYKSTFYIFILQILPLLIPFLLIFFKPQIMIKL